MSDILRILQITFGDSWKAIQFAIRKAIQIAIQKRGNAIQNAVQDGRKAIQCHMKCHTGWQKSHTLPYEVPYCTAKMPYA